MVKALFRNLLYQDYSIRGYFQIYRDDILLVGYCIGSSMSIEEVNDFLRKQLSYNRVEVVYYNFCEYCLDDNISYEYGFLRAFIHKDILQKYKFVRDSSLPVLLRPILFIKAYPIGEYLIDTNIIVSNFTPDDRYVQTLKQFTKVTTMEEFNSVLRNYAKNFKVQGFVSSGRIDRFLDEYNKRLHFIDFKNCVYKKNDFIVDLFNPIPIEPKDFTL